MLAAGVREFGSCGKGVRGSAGANGQRANRAAVESYWDTGRTEAFSDGVIAIAITLLILEVNVPETAFDNLWQGILDQWPSYLAYVTSFLTIGVVWLVHHGIFRRLQYANRRLMVINLVLLMAVSFLPFPTKLMAEAIDRSDAERAAVIFYGAALLVTQLLLSALWGSVALDRHLLRPEVHDDEVKTIALVATPNIGFYVAVIVLAIVAPVVAVYGFLLIAVVGIIRSRGDSAQTPPTTSA
jgi:uncharacterized membrane protein